MRSLLAYVGGKASMLKDILPRIPKHTIYTELYFGGGSVFFAKEPCAKEIINDIDGRLVNFYRIAKTRPTALYNELSSRLYSRDVYDMYQSVWRNPTDDAVLNAASTFFMCNCSFGNKPGRCLSVNKTSNFPNMYKNKIESLFTTTKQRNNETTKHFHIATRRDIFIKRNILYSNCLLSRLSNAQIENRDAISLFSLYDTEDSFHFIDPPYLDTEKCYVTNATNDSISTLLDKMTNLKGKFMFTHYKNEMLIEWANVNKFNVQEIDRQSKLCLIKKKETVTELLITNYKL